MDELKVSCPCGGGIVGLDAAGLQRCGQRHQLGGVADRALALVDGEVTADRGRPA